MALPNDAMSALLQAVLARSQTILGLATDGSQACVNIDGWPPPFAGQTYLVIHPGNFSNSDQNDLDETYSLHLTLTLRSDVAPVDRLGSAILLANTTGIYSQLAALRAGLHMDYSTLSLVGGAIGQSNWTGGQTYSLPATVNGFGEPLIFQNCGDPQAKGPDWFHAEGQDEAVTGVAITLDFGGARRTQTIESMT